MVVGRVLVGLIVLAVVAGPLALTPASAGPGKESVMDIITQRVRARVSDSPDAMGVHIAWTPDGPVERSITADEFLDIVQNVIRSAGGLAPPQQPSLLTGSVAQGCGYPVGNANNANGVCMENLAWPFCDLASGFIFHGGAPGQAVLVNAFVPALVNVGPPPAPICGGGFGVARNYVLGVLTDSTVTGVLTYCGAVKHWKTPGPVDIPIANGGYKCDGLANSFTYASVSGTAALFSANFGAGLTLDYFLGGGNSLNLD
jgi:hypothetical protein